MSLEEVLFLIASLLIMIGSIWFFLEMKKGGRTNNE